MFPLRWNFPFRKKDGNMSTIQDALDNAGQPYTLPTASANTKGGVKIGLRLSMSGQVLNADSQLPEYTSSDSGKVLGIDDDGDLQWFTLQGGAKIYYKDFTNIGFTSSKPIATYDGTDVSATGLQIAMGLSSGGVNNNVSVAGYTAISAVAIDKYTGYYMGLSLYKEPSGGAFVGPVISNVAISSGSVGVRVYYVKDEDLTQITT